MISIPASAAYAGDIVTPHELNEELAEAVGAANNLNVENFDAGLLTPIKLATNAHTGILRSYGTTTRTTTWARAHTKGEVLWIPDEAGDRWVETVTTGDGVLHCTLGADFQDTAPGPVRIWVGLRVDGVIVAQSPIGNYSEDRGTRFAAAMVPVGGGAHVIEPIFGIHPGSAPATTKTVSWYARSLVVREIAR